MAAPRILVAYEGSRGDAQPWLVAARALIDAGFEVMVTGNGDAASMAKDFEVPFTRSRLSLKKIITEPEVTAKFQDASTAEYAAAVNKAREKYETSEIRAREVQEFYQFMQDWKPSLVLAHFLCLPVTLSMANYFQIPVITISLQAQRYSKHCLPFFAPAWLPSWLYRPFWRLVNQIIIAEGLKDALPILTRTTGLPKAKLNISQSEYLNYYSASAAFLSICCYSEAIHGALPADFNANHVVTGPLMPSEEQQVKGATFGAEERQLMEEFLAKGDAPVYLGFGSIIGGSSKFMTLLCLRAMKVAGERCILLRGWSDMSIEHLKDEPDEAELRAFCSEKVLFVDKAPHAWLFPRCKVVVHHGGAGTFNASCRSGVPTVIVAIFADQPVHAELLNQRGFGVGLKSMKRTTPQQLAEAVRKCIDTPWIQEKAKEIAEEMANEDGATKLVEVVKDYMESHVKTGKHMEMKKALDHARKSSSCCLPCCAKTTNVSY